MHFQNRKEDAERKRLEALEKKKERQRLIDEEDAGLKSTKPSARPTKVTRAQIQSNNLLAGAAKKKDNKIEEELPELEENVNRLQIEEGSARNVDEALSVLG